MPLTIFYKDNTTLTDLGAIELDAVIQEDQNFQQVVSQYPVENAADKSDHIRNEPTTITIQGLISNFPVQVVENIDESLTQSAFANRVNVAYDKLLDIREKKALCDVVSSLKLFSNMVMTSLSIPRNSRTGDALNFTASFKEFEVTEITNSDLSNILAVDDAENVAPRKQNGGKQTPSTPNDTDSFLYNTLVEPFL